MWIVTVSPFPLPRLVYLVSFWCDFLLSMVPSGEVDNDRSPLLEYLRRQELWKMWPDRHGQFADTLLYLDTGFENIIMLCV